MECKKFFHLQRKSTPEVILATIKFILVVLFWCVIGMNNESVFATIDPNNYTVDMTMQNQNQGIEILGAGVNEMYVSTMRTLTVNTNAPSGYRVYVNVPADEETGGNLMLVGGSSTSPLISKLGTTPANASTLSANTWGFGIPNTVTGLPTNTFSPSYAVPEPAASSTYSGVVISPGYTLIRNVTGAAPSNDSFNVYYGMRLGSEALSTTGTFRTSVSYHVLIDATDVVGGEAVIVPDNGPKSGFENVTVTTSLEVDFVPENLSVTIGGQDCTNPRGNISTGVLRISCTTPAHTPGQEDVVVNIGSLGISYTIADGYEYLETGDVKITNVSYVSGTNVNGTPHPTVDEDNNVNFDLTFKSGVTENDQTFTARYRFTMTNTTSSDYIFSAPVSNLVLRLSSTTTSEVYYELSGIAVGDTIPANSTVTFDVILSADYASGTHGVEGEMGVEPVEDKTGSLVGSIYGSNQGDLTGDNELAMFQLSVQNTFSSDKTFTIDTIGNNFVITNSTGGFLDAQTISANSTATYTFYVKKADGATYGSDFVNAAIVISYDGIETNSGTLKLAVDKDPSFVDTEAPYISGVSIVRNDTIGSATVTWSGTDNVGVASYAIYPCTKNGDAYSCGSPVTGISGDATSYTLTGLSDGLYGVVVVGYDDEGNTATQDEIDDATTEVGHAARSDDTEIRWTFNIVGQITNGSLSNNGDTIQMGGSYSGTIIANSGYNTPGSATVKMNGRTLTSSEYSYSNGTVRITIPVDGDIEVTANCPWDWCLIEGTLIALADGTTIPIEQINYDTLLKVWNYETGAVGAEYPAWIEKRGTAMSYQLTKFDDGTELKTAGWHGVFDVDLNAFISIDDKAFGVGHRVYKVNENDELEAITVTSIEMITEEVHYYHVVSSQYYNIIANSVITTDGAVYLSNLYGFDENIKWPEIRNEVISDPDNLYTYEDFADIGMPRKMFDDLRVREAKYLASTYGITLDVFKGYLLSNQLNTDIWLHYCDGSERLREEFCPTPVQTIAPSNKTAPIQTKTPAVIEEDATEDRDVEAEHLEPLGETTSNNTTTEVKSDDFPIESILIETAAIATTVGLFLLATKDYGKNEKQ